MDSEPTGSEPVSAESSEKRVIQARQTYRISLWLYLATALTSAAVCLATFDHAPLFPWRSYAAIQMVVLCAVILPLWLSLLFRSEMARLLFIIVFRLLGFLGGLALAQTWEGEAKKSFAVGLLACYFVVLVLESWLHIRDRNRSSRPTP